MKEWKVGVVGGGVVGQAMNKMCQGKAQIYDPHLPLTSNSKEQVNECDIAFICVPTPMMKNGACDTSIVEESVKWLKTPLIVIRSTVAPGTSERLSHQFKKRVVFQPEYLGETPAHMFTDMSQRDFVVLGGKTEDCIEVANFYKCFYNSLVHFHFCDWMTAELCKYMENAFYAMKVVFVNEWYDIATAHGVPFDILREAWLADTRISRDHTFVYPDKRGFSGKCLPKDCNAIVYSSKQRGFDPLFMKSCLEINDKLTS